MTRAMVDLTCYAAVMKDAVAWDRELEPFLLLDYQRLERIVTSRGITFIMIEMPEACKVIDQALSRGRLWPEMLPETFGSIRSGHRKFLRCLTTKVFDDGGFLRDDVEAKAIFYLRQLLLMAKKIEEECSDASKEAEVTTFRQIDESLFAPSLNWDGDDLLFGDRRLDFGDNLRCVPDMFSFRDTVRPKLLQMVHQVSDRLVSRLPVLDWRHINPRHGPGAVADARTGTDKYRFPTWPAKLERTFPYSYFAMSREDLSVSEAGIIVGAHEPPCRLMAVQKTLKAPRMIASEPASHQFIQLGLMEWFRLHMPRPLRNSIDFKKQELSRALCLEASRTGDMATVDLSAASDRLSCWVVERFFRGSQTLLEALHSCRTRWLINATGVGEAYSIRLKKYAPMGNGTTFPVQSWVYAVIAIASVLYEERLEPTWPNIDSVSKRIRVYGDDIILPSSAVLSLVSILEYFQLKVNSKKTFSRGHFRESCGIDAYAGVDVTPVYLSSLTLNSNASDSLSSWTDVSKNAARRGLPTLASWLEDRIPRKVRELLPRTKDPVGCLSLWSHFAGISGCKRRYNRKLHRFEMLALTSQSKLEKTKRHSYGDLLQYFLEDPAPDDNWAAGFTTRKRTQLRVRWVPLA